MKKQNLSYNEIIKYADKTLAIEGYELKKTDKKYIEKYVKGLITQKEVFEYAIKSLSE